MHRHDPWASLRKCALVSLNPRSQYSDIVGTVISAIEVRMQTTLVKHAYPQILESS